MRHSLLLGVVGVFVPFGAGSAWGQTVTDPATFPITGFEVVGDLPLPPERVSALLAPYVRSDASLETLGLATQAVDGALQQAGWGLYRLQVPPQELGGVLRLQTLRFDLGQVEVQGATTRGVAGILMGLPSLQPGHTPNLHDLAVQTALSNENPSKHLTVTLKPSDQTDRVDALVQVAEQPVWSSGAHWANTGSRGAGRDRLTLVAAHHNLWKLDHQASVAYTTSLERSGQVSQWGVSYRWPVYRQGASWSVAWSWSDVVGDFGGFTSQGGGHALGVTRVQHMAPQGPRRSWWSVGIDLKHFDAGQTSAAGVVVPSAARSRLSTPLVLGYHSRWSEGPIQSAAGVDAAWHGWAQGRLASYQSENPGLSQTRWMSAKAHASHRRPLGERAQLSIRGQAQWASTALLAGEQFGVGGATSVRGTQERPLAADSGLQGSFEASTPLFHPSWRAMAFVDMAWLRNRSSTATGRVAVDHVASWGAGVLYSDQAYRQFNLVYGHVLNGSVSPLSVAPRRGDSRWHASVSVRF